MNLLDFQTLVTEISTGLQESANNMSHIAPPVASELSLLGARLKVNVSKLIDIEIENIMLGKSTAARTMKGLHFIQTQEEIDLSYHPQIESNMETLETLATSDVQQRVRNAMFPICLFYAQKKFIDVPVTMGYGKGELLMTVRHPLGAFETHLKIHLDIDRSNFINGKITAVYEDLLLEYKNSYIDWAWICTNILRPLYALNNMDWELGQLKKISHEELTAHMAKVMGQETETHHELSRLKVEELLITLTLGDKTFQIDCKLDGYLEADGFVSEYYHRKMQFSINCLGDESLQALGEIFPNMLNNHTYRRVYWDHLPAMIQHQIYNNIQAALRDKFSPEELLGRPKEQANKE